MAEIIPPGIRKKLSRGTKDLIDHLYKPAKKEAEISATLCDYLRLLRGFERIATRMDRVFKWLDKDVEEGRITYDEYWDARAALWRDIEMHRRKVTGILVEMCGWKKLEKYV